MTVMARWRRRPRRAAGHRRVRRVVGWLAGGLAVVLLAGIGVLAWRYPSVLAAACPRCYGLAQVTGRLYAEPGLPATQRQRIVDAVTSGERQVAAFYGGRTSAPRVLACTSTACYHRIGGGGERGVAVLNRVVLLSPGGIDPVIAAHELSHVELHQRLGRRSGAVPHWFDEGLAVVVSDDARYLRPGTPDGSGDRCLVEPDGPLPATLAGWLHAADPQLYPKAACQVSRYLAGHGGQRAAHDLIVRVRDGESFAAVVGG